MTISRPHFVDKLSSPAPASFINICRIMFIMLSKHQSLPHAAFSHLYLHLDGSEDTYWTSQSPALPHAVFRFEVVDAPLAQMFPNQYLCPICRS